MSKLSWGGAIVVVAILASSGAALERKWSLEHSQRLAQASMPPTILLGKWRCEGSFQGQRIIQIEAYTPGNFQTALTFRGQQIILGGTYTATAAGNNSLRVSYQPFDWRPRQICSGPGGIGGNCVPVNFEPSTEQLFFPNSDSYRTRLGACRRLE